MRPAHAIRQLVYRAHNIRSGLGGIAMRLAVVMPAATAQWGGVQRFAAEIVPALEQLVEVETFRMHPASGERRLPSFARGVTALSSRHRRYPFDAVFTTFHWPPKLWPIPTYGVIHDLRATLEKRAARGSAERLMQRSISRTWRRVLVPTEHVAADVRRVLGLSRISVVGEGTDHLDRHLGQAITTDSVVVLGGRAPHKRTALGLQAGVEVAAAIGCPLVVVGTDPVSPLPCVSWVTSPTDEELVATLERARVVVAPSAYEGFGLAVGEALRAGAPVAYCHDSTLAALVGEAGIAAAPARDALAAAALKVWHDNDALSARARHRVHDLTWERTALTIVDVIRVDQS